MYLFKDKCLSDTDIKILTSLSYNLLPQLIKHFYRNKVSHNVPRYYLDESYYTKELVRQFLENYS